jgi:hypothetical protein
VPLLIPAERNDGADRRPNCQVPRHTSAASRKLKYLFEDLQDILFRMKPSTADKFEILRVVESQPFSPAAPG